MLRSRLRDDFFEDDFDMMGMGSFFGRHGESSLSSMFPSFESRFGNFGENDFGPNNAGSSTMVSYSSYSSSSTGGGEPVVVKKSFYESRVGSDVAERRETFSDSRTGTEGVSVSRRIADRERIVSKVRDRNGTEKTVDTLRNIDENTKEDFDRDWEGLSTNHANRRYITGSADRRSDSNVPSIEYLPPDDRNETRHDRSTSSRHSGEEKKKSKSSKNRSHADRT